MLEVIGKFFSHTLRVLAIVVAIIFCTTGLKGCMTESETESLTVLSLQSSDVVKYHVGNVPVRTIVSSSNVEEPVDIVYFGTNESFEKYSKEFEFLETVTINTVIPLDLYIPYNGKLETEAKFSEIIDGIIEGKYIISDVNGDVGYLDYNLNGDKAYAFYTLLFNYFSEGKSSKNLTDEQREDVINKVKNFVEEHPSINTGKFATFNSDLVNNDTCITVKFKQKVFAERTIGVVTENGKKYLDEVINQFKEDDEFASLGLISCESMDLIGNFIDTNVVDFSYNSEMEWEAGAFFLIIIWGIISGIVLIISIAITIDDSFEFYVWMDIDRLFGSGLTLVSLLFNGYWFVVILAISWVAVLLHFEDWIDDLAWEFSYSFGTIGKNISNCFDTIKENISNWIADRKKKKEEKAEALEKAKTILDEIGEENGAEYLKVWNTLDELKKFNEELGINTSVWENISTYMQIYPSSLPLISKLLGEKSVVCVLNAYRDLPRDENGKLRSEFELKDRTKTVLMKLNKVTEKRFEEKKKVFHMDTNAWLSLAESELNNEIDVE